MTKVRIHEKVSSSQFDALDCRLCVKLAYGVVPKGLLTFLRFLGNAEFSPWKRLPDVIKKKFTGVFETASDMLFGKKCLCYPRSGDEA